MSEYQYYEFLAIERPLSNADVRWLRSISTRAQITATSFTNEYHWGDFKGDPRELMKRCFDAHVYTSNFGIRRFMLKVSKDALEPSAIKAYRGDCGVHFRAFSHGTVLDFAVEEEPGEWDDDDSTAWMASLAPLRNDLLDGDRRSLYLAWLLNVQFDALGPDAYEPPVPPGLGALSAPCEALVDFLRVDRTLLALAAEQSPARVATEVSEGNWRVYLANLTATERDGLLLHLLTHDDPASRRNLRTRLRRERSDAGAQPGAAEPRETSGGRTVAELSTEWRRRLAIAQQRAAEAAARGQARLAEEQAQARHKHLTQVAARAAATWDEVESLIQSRSPKSYDRAVALLVDLRDAAILVKKGHDFPARLGVLRAAHASKPSLIRRLDAAELR
jgi:hypothetical protein